MKASDAIAYFSPREGRIPWMYLDSVGLVTCGIGKMLPTPEAAQELPFILRGSSTPASAHLIGLEWAAVKAQKPAMVASYYLQCTVLELPSAAIDADFAKSFSYFTGILRRHFPKFDSFPDPVQLGLLDMIYSVGEGELFLPKPPGYPHFCQAVAAQDWLSCAEECRRAGVSDARNADCAELFKSAVIPS